ncbi:response regulator receiver domain protein [Synechococcus sp. PCC 7335]|uniref:response regulator n=1 Tax=Synechococcus sp. (strain ATCC 29403 / PCC 7335) TaxID=91464 RepID=UPI00017ECAEA|nr:response regulator transcription factor [Synechococcus sp. PCC 7335]EDX86965.1 response regulator receiver domain protein [Synechococcus sp. PCC 7335]
MDLDIPIRVLVAEDHNIVRQGIVAILNQQAQITVIAEAKNGVEAVEMHALHQPDITLMDLRMPQMEGLEAINRIREATPAACIIILTTYDTDEDIYRGLQAGARGYLLKDTTAEDLATAVRQVHHGKRYIPIEVGIRLTERIQESDLTDRELEVLGELTEGKSNLEIAKALSISEGTVKFHINNILSKFGVSDRTQAVITALRRGITRIRY